MNPRKYVLYLLAAHLRAFIGLAVYILWETVSGMNLTFSLVLILMIIYNIVCFFVEWKYLNWWRFVNEN